MHAQMGADISEPYDAVQNSGLPADHALWDVGRTVLQSLTACNSSLLLTDKNLWKACGLGTDAQQRGLDG